MCRKSEFPLLWLSGRLSYESTIVRKLEVLGLILRPWALPNLNEIVKLPKELPRTVELTLKVEIILKEREVAFLSPSNMPSTFEFFYCAPEKFKC